MLVKLMNFIGAIENVLGMKAIKNLYIARLAVATDRLTLTACGIPMKSSAESGLKRAVIPVEIEHIHG